MMSLPYKVAAIAAGFALCANLLDARSSLAASFYDFTVTWQDSSTSTGWFKVDPAVPTSMLSVPDPSSSYDLSTWNFLDFSFTHAGKTYGLGDLAYGDMYRYDYPVTSSYQAIYGNLQRGFRVRVSPGGQHLSSFAAVDSVVDSQDFFYGYSETPLQYASLVVWGERTASANLPSQILKTVPDQTFLASLAKPTAATGSTQAVLPDSIPSGSVTSSSVTSDRVFAPAQAAAVPEPTTIAGIALTGAGLTWLRRRVNRKG